MSVEAARDVLPGGDVVRAEAFRADCALLAAAARQLVEALIADAQAVDFPIDSTSAAARDAALAAAASELARGDEPLQQSDASFRRYAPFVMPRFHPAINRYKDAYLAVRDGSWGYADNGDVFQAIANEVYGDDPDFKLIPVFFVTNILDRRARTMEEGPRGVTAYNRWIVIKDTERRRVPIVLAHELGHYLGDLPDLYVVDPVGTTFGKRLMWRAEQTELNLLLEEVRQSRGSRRLEGR